MSDADDVAVELSPLWQFIHPNFNHADSDQDEDDGEHDDSTAEGHRAGRPADYVKLSRSAPRLGQLMRYLNDFEEDEEVQTALLEKDPVTQQTLLQWAVLNDHFMLVEYLVKRLRRSAFAFDPESVDVVVYDRWIEMKDDLPNPAEVAERQKQRDMDKAKRLAERAMANTGDEADDEEMEEGEEEEAEPMPEDVVYDSLEDYHEEWGDRGVGIVKRIGELGVYVGPRLADGTKQGLGQSLFPSGDCYTGEYKANQREGRGVYWWAKAGALYTGDWFRNLRHGHGRMVYPDGSRYIGRWVNGKRSGVGRYTYKDGSSYDGTWLKDEKHGSGTYHLLDGSTFTGTFQHNAFVAGEWRLASGTVRYIGNFDKDVPVGAGAFVHRCGLKEGSFQQEGSYTDGRWVPSMLKGTSHVVPHIELTSPPQQPGAPRVPMEFAADCNGRTMADLIKVANFAPLLRWVAALPSPQKDKERGVTLKAVEVRAIRYDVADAGVLSEVTILPVLVDAAGRRVHLPEETVTLTPPTTRLVVLLSCPGTESVVLLEKATEPASTDAAAQQSRLPRIRIGEDASVDGPVVSGVGRALRLQLASTSTMALLMAPMRSNPLHSNAEESVWLYAQQVHPDTMAQLSGRLQRWNAEGGAAAYEAVPLSHVAQASSDAITVMAATQIEQRRSAQTLPAATTAPQRPPTPPPPTLEPRPELQPLYDARARRDEAEAEH